MVGINGREREGVGDEWKLELQQIHSHRGDHQISNHFGWGFERAVRDRMQSSGAESLAEQ